jgi:hypothetical protein
MAPAALAASPLPNTTATPTPATIARRASIPFLYPAEAKVNAG